MSSSQPVLPSDPNREPNPFGWYAKLNANFLTLGLVTPEYSVVSNARNALKPSERATPHPGGFRMQPEFITVEKLKLRFARGGFDQKNSQKPTVLLLSPLPQSILGFDQLWDRLCEHCQVVALDLPGFGRSEGGSEVMNLETQSKILDKFIRKLDLHDVHIVAPDVGLPIALHYAIHRKEDNRCKSLLLGDGPCVTPYSNGSIINKMVNWAFWRLVFRIAGAGAFVYGGQLLGNVRYTPSHGENADYLASYTGRIPAIMDWFKGYGPNLKTIEPHYKDLDLPVHIFWGELDVFLLKETGTLLQQRLKRSKMTVLKGCGHYCYQDKSKEFADMIVAWTCQEGYKAVQKKAV